MGNIITPRNPHFTIMEIDKEYIKLQPFIAPVNYKSLTSAKAIQIVHTLMGNFFRGDKDKISQMEVKIPSFLGADRPPPNCLTQSPTPLKVARESPDSHK
jgi:hypothetical protein